MTVPYRHASKAERTNRTAVESTRASLLQAGFPDTWWAVCMIYFVAMWNGHLPAQARRRRAVSDVPWSSHICTSPSLKVRKSDRWRSKLTRCILVEVTMGPAGVWGRCCGVVPLFRFTGSNRPSVVHVRRSIDIDFPEIVSLRQRLMVHGAVADRTLPAPGVAAEKDGWTLAEEYEDIQDDGWTPCWPPTTLRQTTKW